jgi:hypothetical protein
VGEWEAMSCAAGSCQEVAEMGVEGGAVASCRVLPKGGRDGRGGEELLRAIVSCQKVAEIRGGKEL